jgi:hypothetical protein
MQRLWLAPRCRSAGSLAVLVALALTAGCGAKAKLSGRVLYKNKPLPGGWVSFRLVDSRAPAVSAQLDEEGRYEVTLPPGEVQIAVDNRELASTPLETRPAAPALPPGMKLPPGVSPQGAKPAPASTTNPERPPGEYVPIPPRYYDFETSGLTHRVKSGSETHDIELE